MESSRLSSRSSLFNPQDLSKHVGSCVDFCFDDEILMNFLLFLSYQAIRVLGLLGALDPYKHKVNIGMIDQSRDASAVSLSESKSSQDSCKHLNSSQVNSLMIYKQFLVVLLLLLPVCLLLLTNY